VPVLQPSASTPKKSAAHRNNYKKKPSWSSDWVKKFLEQDPNADDYDKYSLPLGTEDTNEEILSITEGIEGTRLNNTGHASSSKNWLAEAQLSNCPLIRLVQEPQKVSEIIVITKAQNTGQKAGQLWTFWWKNQSNRHTIW